MIQLTVHMYTKFEDSCLNSASDDTNFHTKIILKNNLESVQIQYYGEECDILKEKMDFIINNRLSMIPASVVMSV